MPYFHTTADKTKLYVGSGAVYIANIPPEGSAPEWKPLGILSALAVTPNRETAQPAAVNGEHDEYVVKETEDINFAMQQLDPQLMDEVTGNLNVVEIQTGAKVVGFTQNLQKKEKNTFEELLHQSFGDNSLPVEPENLKITSGDSELQENTDYIVAKDTFGRYGITFLADQSEECTVTYDYTPADQITLHTGGKTNVEPKMLKIEADQADGRSIRVTYFRVSFTSGAGIGYKDDNSADIIDFNVTMQAKQDVRRPAGYQLKETVFFRK
ncbi:MAG: hypothetical protein J1G30_04255 [Spirochaetales bacterium]|nr:hypothetical protein [Spirochaetales bacterium]